MPSTSFLADAEPDPSVKAARPMAIEKSSSSSFCRSIGKASPRVVMLPRLTLSASPLPAVPATTPAAPLPWVSTVPVSSLSAVALETAPPSSAKPA